MSWIHSHVFQHLIKYIALFVSDPKGRIQTFICRVNFFPSDLMNAILFKFKRYLFKTSVYPTFLISRLTREKEKNSRWFLFSQWRWSIKFNAKLLFSASVNSTKFNDSKDNVWNPALLIPVCQRLVSITNMTSTPKERGFNTNITLHKPREKSDSPKMLTRFTN